jgi:membrane-associated phospholipid phosphatase
VVEYSNVLNVAVYAAGLFTENEHVRITGRIMLETITVSGLSALLLRYITGRERPPYTDDHLAFKWFGTTERFQAFPSGHAVVGCALSTVLAERIDTWWSRVFFYGIAGLSSYVRILNNQHWASDVFIGSILGFGAGYYMLNREENRVETGNKSGISFFPGINGINIIYSF